MIVDTSAIIAILRAEDEAGAILLALANAEQRLMSASSYLEAGIVMANDKSPRGVERLNLLIEKASIDIVPTSESDAVAGIAAHIRYGRGSGQKAKLNFGDCFVYALAKSRNLPLLFKGDDFIHTDIEPALKPA